MYFSQSHFRPRTTRYLLFDIDLFPSGLEELLRLWAATERIANAVDRAPVMWNLPCAFAWSDRQFVTKFDRLGMQAAVVRSSCGYAFEGAAPRRAANISCCNAFFDMLPGRCDGLAEHVYSCTHHVHRTRFEQEVSWGDLERSRSVRSLADAREQPRVLRLQLASVEEVWRELGAVVHSTPRRYRDTASRRCPNSTSVCTNELRDMPVHVAFRAVS